LAPSILTLNAYPKHPKLILLGFHGYKCSDFAQDRYLVQRIGIDS
jgi:hypothetical protein